MGHSTIAAEVFFKKNKIEGVLKKVIPIIFIVVFIAGCSSSPKESFMNLPLYMIYTGDEFNVSDDAKVSVTLKDFFDLAFNKQAQKGWKKIDDSTWMLIITTTDKVNGRKTKINIVVKHMQSPERATLTRILVNGEEGEQYVQAKQLQMFVMGTIKAKEHFAQNK